MLQRHRRHGGFTIVELLVVVVASSIVIAGAFALHNSFSRQNDRVQKIAEVQQTLRVGRGFLEKQLRVAGSGLKGGSIKIFMRDSLGNCVERDVYGLMFHNSNNLNATTTPDVTPADADTDPDWFEMAYLDPYASGVRVTGLPGSSDGSSENIQVNSHGDLVDQCGSMFTIPMPNGQFCTYFIKQLTGGPKININANGCSHASACMPSGGAVKKLIDCTCNASVNPGFADAVASGKTCEQYVMGAAIASVGPGIGGVRLFPQAEATTLFSLPFPMLAKGTLNTTTSVVDWSSLTDQIEDLQFEVFMRNGTVYGTATNSMDVPLADSGQIRAVRYTIRAASRTPVTGAFSQTIAPYADQCVGNCTFSDGRVRRLVQGMVQLRNFGML